MSSPPYEASLAASQGGVDWAAAKRETSNGGAHQAPGASAMASYPDTPGNIGNTQGETFWSSAKQIIAECFAILRPGGHAVWVLKAFVRKGKIVDFPSDWRKLCEAIGFETVLIVEASLVAEHGQPDIFDVSKEQRSSRKSFFRRLAEAKGSPRIDFEVVLFMEKPT